MGKLHISDDLKSKLDRVLGLKMDDKKQDINTGPAPRWEGNQEKRKLPPPPPPPPPPIPVKKEEEEDDFMTAVSSLKPRKRKKKKKKVNPIIVVFGGSVLVGIGLTLGFKLGKIIFY